MTDNTPITDSKDFQWNDKRVADFVRERIIAPCDYLHTQLDDRIKSFKEQHSPKESKEWEIISFKSSLDNIARIRADGLYYFPNGPSGWTEEVMLSKHINHSIHSVRRISDNEVFTASQRVEYRVANQSWDEFWDATIEKIIINGNGNLVFELFDEKAHYPRIVKYLDNIRTIKQEPVNTPLFTTEDGKPVFAGDNICLLSTTNWITSYPVAACKSPFKGPTGNEFKYFSTESAARTWVLENKPLFNLKEIIEYTPIDSIGLIGLRIIAEEKIKGGK